MWEPSPLVCIVHHFIRILFCFAVVIYSKNLKYSLNLSVVFTLPNKDDVTDDDVGWSLVLTMERLKYEKKAGKLQV